MAAGEKGWGEGGVNDLLMFLLTLRDKKDEGEYAVQDTDGDKVLFMFEDEDDATRYAMMLELEKTNYSEMDIIEVDDELAIKTCKMHTLLVNFSLKWLKMTSL